MKHRIDDVDKILITQLQKNGRKPLSEIGREMGMSHVAVRKRLGKLIREDIIKISADLNTEALETKIAIMLVEVENSERLKELTELFKDCPRTLFLSGLSASQLLSIIACENLSTLESVVGVCSLRVQKGIRRSEVYIGSSPVYPRFLPMKVSSRKKTEVAPCGIKCQQCRSFNDKQCFGCPATRYYNGPI